MWGLVGWHFSKGGAQQTAEWQIREPVLRAAKRTAPLGRFFAGYATDRRLGHPASQSGSLSPDQRRLRRLRCGGVGEQATGWFFQVAVLWFDRGENKTAGGRSSSAGGARVAVFLKSCVAIPVPGVPGFHARRGHGPVPQEQPREATSPSRELGVRADVPAPVVTGGVVPQTLWDRAYLLLMVTPGKSSVRNGVRGKPAPLKRLTTGLSAHP